MESGTPDIVAGSRGTYSSLVATTGDGVANIHSIAHGAIVRENKTKEHPRIVKSNIKGKFISAGE